MRALVLLLLSAVLIPVEQPVHVKYYPETLVFATHTGNIGLTLDDDTVQLCSVLFQPSTPYECHDSVPKPFYKEITW
jgi:hypothetical protein